MKYPTVPQAEPFGLTRIVPLLIVMIALFPAGAAFAHEPLFGLGPETLWQGGVGVETEFEFEDEAGEQVSALHYEILYGVTSDLSITLQVPQILERRESGNTGHGLGDIGLRAKYQFFRKDALGSQHKVSGILGIKTPTGDEDADPALGTGTTDVLFGVSYGYESRSWYHFLTTRYRWRTESGVRNPGDQLLIDGAVGYRPWQREYTEWDLVGLLEMNAEFAARNRVADVVQAKTGGNTLWLGPTVLFSPNPQWMTKGGIQWPVYEDLNGQKHSEFRAVLGIEHHF